MTFGHAAASAVVIFEAVARADPSWAPEPLALPLPEWTIEQGWAQRTHADRAARFAYFAAGISDTLYGTAQASSPRWSTEVSADVGNAHAFAVEVLRFPAQYASRALVAIHLDLPDQPLRTLEQIVRIRPGERSAIGALLPAGWALVPGARRAVTIAFAAGELDDAQPDLTLWQLASATTLASYRPSEQDLHSAAQVQLSADWDALVLRDGIGFRTHPATPDFDQFARVLVHSVYLDVLLLARIQLALADSIAGTLAGQGLSNGDPGSLIRLERDMFDYRRQVWWTSTGEHRHATDLLRAYQAQHVLTERVGALIADVADAARLAQSISGARTSNALALISLIGVPLTVCYAGAALLPWHGWGMLILATAIACVLAALLGFAPQLRHLTRVHHYGPGGPAGLRRPQTTVGPDVRADGRQ